MSTTEDEYELKELVIQTLEASGVLPQIRAQLRASVFLALEEAAAAAAATNVNSGKRPAAIVNVNLREYLSTPKGVKTAHLVRDFLQFFNMKSTLSVFDCESSFGHLYDDDTKESALSEFNVPSVGDVKRCLLDSILNMKNVQGAITLKPNNTSLGEVGSLKSRKLEPIVGGIGAQTTFTSSAPPPSSNNPLDRDPFFDDDDGDDHLSVNKSWAADAHLAKTKLTPINEKNTISVRGSSSRNEVGENLRTAQTSGGNNGSANAQNDGFVVTETDFTLSDNNRVASAGNIIVPTREEFSGYSKAPSKSVANKPTNEYYDEDFQSSVSLQSNQKTENDSISEGEIEESLSEIGDELSVALSDLHSQDQNSTVDNSVSQIGAKADYTENVK